MVGDLDPKHPLPEPLRRLPADLAAVTVLTLLALLVVFLSGLDETPLRILLGLPFVLFLPGYAFVAALFPEAGQSPETTSEADTDHIDTDETDTDDREEPNPLRGEGIDGSERVALSFGLSIAVVPLIGLVLNVTPWGIRLVPITVSVSGFTLAATAVAARRRRELPPEERFAVPYRQWCAGAREELLEPDTRADAALNVLLAVSVLLAAVGVGYAVAVPKQGEQFTEFYLLTETDDGELVADDYPREFVRGESKRVVVGVGNHEHEPVDYTVVVELHRVRFETVTPTAGAAGATTATATTRTRIEVVEEVELRRFHPRVEDNGTWHRRYDVTPTMTGEKLRLTFLLYKGAAPTDPTVENAYRERHLWVNVSAPANAGG